MQWRRLGVLLATGAVGAAGCTGDGPASRGESAYLLVDREARAAGFRVLLAGDPQAPVFPVEVDPAGARLELIARDGAPQALPVGPGQLLHVRGATARLEIWTLQVEVLVDVVRITASPERARALAAALGAAAPEPLGLSGPERSWRLRGTDALVRSAWMGEPAEVLEVAPELVAGVGATPMAAAAAPGSPATGPIGDGAGDILALPGDQVLPEFVGLHTVNGQRVLLDADGGWTFLDQQPCVKADGTAGMRGRTRRLGDHLLLEGAGLLLAPGGAP